MSLSSAETQALAARLASLLRAGDMLTLRGDLGAGKTTFVQGLARGLGSDAAITSPTFTLFQEYCDGRIPLIHGDAYRLTGGSQLVAIGFDEYLNAGAVVALEWPENVADALPHERLDIHIVDTGEGDGRTITFTPHGTRWETFAQDWKRASC